MEIVENQGVLDPEGDVDSGDEDEKVSRLLEFSCESGALKKANLYHLKVKINLKKF